MPCCESALWLCLFNRLTHHLASKACEASHGMARGKDTQAHWQMHAHIESKSKWCLCWKEKTQKDLRRQNDFILIKMQWRFKMMDRDRNCKTRRQWWRKEQTLTLLFVRQRQQSLIRPLLLSQGALNNVVRPSFITTDHPVWPANLCHWLYVSQQRRHPVRLSPRCLSAAAASRHSLQHCQLKTCQLFTFATAGGISRGLQCPLGKENARTCK